MQVNVGLTVGRELAAAVGFVVVVGLLLALLGGALSGRTPQQSTAPPAVPGVTGAR